MANILSIIPDIQCPGGLQKIALLKAQYFIGNGHEVTVIDDEKPILDNLRYINNLPNFENLESFEPTFQNLSAFNEIIKSRHIDLIIYEGFYENVNKFLQRWKQDHKTPIISIYHSTPDLSVIQHKDEIRDKGWKRFIKQTFFPVYRVYTKWRTGKFLSLPVTFSDRVVLLSPKFIPLYQKLTHSNYTPVAIGNFFVPDSTTSTIQRRKRIVYLGRIEESVKRLTRAIHIWERLAPDFPDWEFILVGEGSSKGSYLAMIDERKIPRISFKRYTAYPQRELAEASIFIMVSDHEGFSLGNVEAMGEGCIPVVYNSFLSVSDIIDNGINGYLIPPFEEDKFVEAMSSLMSSSEKREKMSFEAKKKSLAFLPANIMAQWEKLIDEVINNKHPQNKQA